MYTAEAADPGEKRLHKTLPALLARGRSPSLPMESNPAIALNWVVLPALSGPAIVIKVPALASNETPLRAMYPSGSTLLSQDIVK